MNLKITGFGLPTDTVQEEIPLKITVNLDNDLKISFFVTEIILHLHCEDQSVNLVYGNNSCLL